MARVVTIHQPSYLPWLGYFNKLAQADVYVFLDSVQYTRGDFQNRNRVKGRTGPAWLTVPLRTKGHRDKTLAETEIANEHSWQSKHLGTLRGCYASAPYFDRYVDDLERLIRAAETDFCTFVLSLLRYFLALLDIDADVIRASDLPVEGTGSQLVENLCRYLGADVYLSGAMGRDYLDVESFKGAGIDVAFQDYNHPVYPQLFGEFLPNMCIVDLLMNVGEERAREVVREGYALER